MSNLQKVVAIQDNDSHWYVIPDFKRGMFRHLLSLAETKDDYDEFEDAFSQYRTGGDLNNTQLYAEI